MEWVKSSNVITVTKSVTSVEAVITRYLLTSKSEGVTIDGEVWSDIRQYPTSEYRYVWAYDTYHYTDRTTGHTSPYILDTYQAPRFEVNFSTDSYEIHPRWSSVSYITFTITKLNGLTGNVTFRQTSSSKGIGLPIYDSSSGVYSISIENKSTTSTSFSLVVSIGNCVETFTLNGIMVDADSKYLGTVTSLPDNRECVDGDRCFYKPSSNEGSIYIYDADDVSWKEINDSSLGLTDAEKSVIYTEAMKDIIEHIPSGSSILSEYGFFDTIISHIIKAEKSFVDDMYAKNLNVDNGNFKFEITSGIIKVSYNGNTVFQIDPSSGNVFLGQPNSGLTAPESGFMYDATTGEIISKDRKVVINVDGSMEASFKNVVSYQSIVEYVPSTEGNDSEFKKPLVFRFAYGTFVESIAFEVFYDGIRGLDSENNYDILKWGSTESCSDGSQTFVNKDYWYGEVNRVAYIRKKYTDFYFSIFHKFGSAGKLGVRVYAKIRIDTDAM